GCLGCCAKPTTVVSVNEHSKGLRPLDRTSKKHSITDDFWSTSAAEIDNSALQSQRSMSSISTLNQPLDPCSNAGSSSNPPEFVNHGKFYKLSQVLVNLLKLQILHNYLLLMVFSMPLVWPFSIVSFVRSWLIVYVDMLFLLFCSTSPFSKVV
ncbi:unnamed protein product, partial [Linum tenue]